MSKTTVPTFIERDGIIYLEETGDDFADYQPHGDCATGCGHPATEVWQLYRGSQRFEFRCGHCVAQGKLMRAEWYASQIPALKTECEKEMAKCQTQSAAKASA